MKVNGITIKHFLIDAGMRQKDLAEKTGITRATISAVCNGKSCSQETAEKIASGLGVDLVEILERG